MTVVAQTEEISELAVPISVVQNSEKDIIISLSSEILFDVGQSEIKSAADSTLMRAAYLIKRYPKRKVRILGYTDSTPIHNEAFKDNTALSLARAISVKDFLVEKAGIPAERFSVKGYGAEAPKASNDTEAGRRMNRRVEIVLPKG